MVLGGALSGCQGSGSPTASADKNPEVHTLFDITKGTPHELHRPIGEGEIQCESCHPADTGDFRLIKCGGCHGHEQSVTDRLHLTVFGYTFQNSNGCYNCHLTGKRVDFDHGGIANNCAPCHDIGNPFAALPKDKFTHPETGGADCSGCHNTTDWAGATGAPNAHNAANDIVVAALLPTFAGTSMASLTSQSELLSMTMNHGSTDAPAAVMSDCANCHPNSRKSGFFPGVFHDSLGEMSMQQPTSCSSCHLDAMPTGLVGPIATNPARMPPTGEMRHDAVGWAGGAPTNARIVSTNCGICHRVADNSKVTWASGKGGANTVQFHPSLNNAAQAQPTSCMDCHANSRPQGALTKPSASLPAGVSFDHAMAISAATGDCAPCHAATAGPSFSSWRQGTFHSIGAPNPPTCLPCHKDERPASADGWISPTYKNSPFDYGGNTSGATHGDGQDCALCHSGPGTGAWGGTQNWASGHFDHSPTTHAAQTCLACHSSQRPDLQPGTTAAAAAAAIGFDHPAAGAGECLGCHAATTKAGKFVNYTNPSTHTLPGGDWQGGTRYPGSSFSGSSDQSINVTETILVRDGTTVNNVLRTTTITDTIYNGMLHTSAILPAPMSAGPTESPDNTKCWHCHTNTNGTVTSYNNGQYHSALTNFRPTPSGAVAPYPQPTTNCSDCHSYMMPDGIVALKGSDLWPMDHKAVLAAPIMVGAATVARVSDLDCSFCHKSPGNIWSDGVFHADLPMTAVVSDCNGCHYPLMTDAEASDKGMGTLYTMKHMSPVVTSQQCKPCHAMGVINRSTLPVDAKLFAVGTFHSSFVFGSTTVVAPQPTGCIDCHLVSQPAPNVPTQSTVTYALKAGATSTNAAQWMNHGSGLVAGKDCAVCHFNDAQAMGSAWSQSTSLHGSAPLARTCQECHGLVNGGGGTSGAKNNLPAGLTNSTVTTSASAATGIPATTPAQITHDDVNVSNHDCNYCHTQVGAAPSPPIQGKEWAQARFHTSFPAGNPLTMNGGNGRCSNCHMNDNPKSSYTTFNHSNFNNSSNSTDCSNCHTYPGTGTIGAPNWLGGSTSGSGGNR
jgi:hypothetical protein